MSSSSPSPEALQKYKSAMEYSRAGRFMEARTALKDACDLGFAEAAYSLAGCLVDGIGGPQDRKGAMDLLEGAARDADFSGQLRALGLALGWHGTPDWKAGIASRVEEAVNGNPTAQVEIGMLLLMQDADNPKAADWIEAAARANDPMGVSASLRLGIVRGQRPPQATARTMMLETAQHPMARQYDRPLEALPPAPAGADLPAITLDAEDAKTRLAELPLFTGNTARFTSSPDAQTAEDFLPAPVCDYLFARHAARMRPSVLHDPATGTLKPHPHRTSMSGCLSFANQDIVVHTVEQRMAALAGIPWPQAERLVVLAYRPGEEYKPHYDFLEGDGNAEARRELDAAGQRIATVLVTLEDQFRGGATHFPKAEASWKGAQGEALSYRNVLPDGTPDPMTLHAGTPVEAGWKALASLWIRERGYA